MIRGDVLGELTRLIVEKYGSVGVAFVCDDNGDLDYDRMQWESDVVEKPSKDEIMQMFDIARQFRYKTDRRNAYPSIVEQLDVLFHEGYEGWKTSIQAIKDQFPKPA